VLRLQRIAILLLLVAAACGGSPRAQPTTRAEPAAEEASPSQAEDSTGAGEFQLHDSDQSHRAHPSQIESTETEAAIRFFVVDPETGPISGTVIKLNAPDGSAYYTGSTDSQGYAEMLVPAGQRYQLEYLSLGRRTTRANVNVAPGPRQDIRLTLRRHRWRPPPRPEQPETAQAPEPPRERFVLEGVLFDTGRATIQEESYPRLERVVEYMVHMPDARIRISGYTDSMGDAERNRQLSEARAQAVRLYLVAHDIDAGRIEAVGYGEEDPVASNDTEEGRRRNRRIEAVEL